MNKIIILFVLLISCKEKEVIKVSIPVEQTKEIITDAFQKIIDSAAVNGSILVYDAKDDLYYSNNFEWANSGKLPASTFKIPNSIIALETGILENDSTVLKWDGKIRNMKNWNQDLTLKEAFHYSCVPCYQEIARKIGLEKMKSYVTQFNYGNIHIDSTTLDNFWLEGTSRINQFQQIEFLKKFYDASLPISKRTTKIMKSIMIIDINNDYQLSAKTGWSTENGHNGWFVGYLEKDNRVYYFATNIEPKSTFNKEHFISTRKEITMKALRNLKIIAK